MNITLNKYKQILTAFFTQHLQINTVEFGNKFDLTAKEDIIYPVANIAFLDSSTNNNLIIDRWQFTLADLQDPNNSNAEFEIINDLTLIAYDLIAYLNQDQYAFDFQVANVTSINNFTDDLGDVVSGVNFVINIQQQRVINPCSVPLTNKNNGL